VPFYRFQVDVDAPPHVVAERLRAIVRNKPTFSESFRKWSCFGDPVTVPFIGTVQDDSFKIRRDIRYRNSFLPTIRGHITPIGVGARVGVTMYIHPFVAAFMIVWFSVVFRAISTRSTLSILIPGGMLLFFVVLTVVGFIPEAIKAKNLICNAVTSPAPGALQGTAPIDGGR
jgi:hypothetical protein